MTRDDIIRMAREAGSWSQQFKNRDVEYVMSAESLERFAALARADEREEILQMSAATWFQTQADYDAAIRARGQDPMPLFDDWGKDWK
jgi:hypothetical protein